MQTKQTTNGTPHEQTVNRWKSWTLVCLNVALLALVGCGGETADAPEVDPQSVNDNATSTELTRGERDLLARAKGREWESYTPQDLEAYLTPLPDSTSAVYFWVPNTGAAALKELQEAVRGLDTSGIRVAVAVLEGGDPRDELIALRESQIILPAFRLPREGNYGFIPNGVPVSSTLVVSAAGGEGPAPFSSKTPIKAFRPLLEAQAPK